MKCREFIFAIEDNLDKKEENFPEEFKKHFEECQSCRKAFLDQQAVHYLLQEGKNFLEDSTHSSKNSKRVVKFSIFNFVLRAVAVIILLVVTYHLSFKFIPRYFEKNRIVISWRVSKKSFSSLKNISKTKMNVAKIALNTPKKVVDQQQIISSKALNQKPNSKSSKMVQIEQPLYKIVAEEKTYLKVKFNKTVFDWKGMVFLGGHTYKIAKDSFKRFSPFKEIKDKFSFKRYGYFDYVSSNTHKIYFYQFDGFSKIVKGTQYLAKDFFYPVLEKTTFIAPEEKISISNLKFSNHISNISLKRGWNIINNKTMFPWQISQILKENKDIFPAIFALKDNKMAFYKSGTIYPKETFFVYSFKEKILKLPQVEMVKVEKNELAFSNRPSLVLSSSDGLKFISPIFESDFSYNLSSLPAFPISWEKTGILGKSEYGRPQKFTVSNTLGYEKAFKLNYQGMEKNKCIIFEPKTGEKLSLPHVIILHPNQSISFFYVNVGKEG